MTDKQVYKKLQKMAKDYNRSELELAVIDDLLDNDQEYIIGRMKDVLNHGCISGCVGSLIYYKDTYKFFDDYYEDIMELINNIKKETGEDFNNWNGDIKNTGAWLAYEETVRKLMNELQIEY